MLLGQDQLRRNLSCVPWDRTERHLPACRSIAKTSALRFSSPHTQMLSRWRRIYHQLKVTLFSNTPNECFSKSLGRKYIPKKKKVVKKINLLIFDISVKSYDYLVKCEISRVDRNEFVVNRENNLILRARTFLTNLLYGLNVGHEASQTVSVSPWYETRKIDGRNH